MGLLYDDENKLLRNHFVRYDKVVFAYEEENVKNPKKTMSEGRAILTNHRIIFLSNEELQRIYFSDVSKEDPKKKSKKERKKEEEKESALVAVGDDLSTVDLTKAYMDIREKTPYVINSSPQQRKSKYYALWGHAKDIIQYFSLPLGCIKNVELDGDMSAYSMAIIKGKKPSCPWSLCCCCGCKKCTKSWNNETSYSGTTTERILSLGVHLPPCGFKCNVSSQLLSYKQWLCLIQTGNQLYYSQEPLLVIKCGQLRMLLFQI
ncbi:uncharacterized protein [Amphiura filiformis]|uniref:uncharacterized protein n=1 Tax=Amphiura filiformis TaxID=82378 RepID=UPI003B20B916